LKAIELSSLTGFSFCNAISPEESNTCLNGRRQKTATMHVVYLFELH